jgi:hypothetical protein
MIPIIGFGHRSRVGKDTCAGFLNTELRMLGTKTVHISFASKLKEVCYDVYGWAGMKRAIHYETNPADRQIKLPELGKTPVEIWVEVGNKLREVYDKTWIQAALRGQQNTQVVIVSDVRYPNELDVIHALGGKVFKVSNSRATVLDTVADNALEGCDINLWDGVIANEGTLAELHTEMRALAVMVRT